MSAVATSLAFEPLCQTFAKPALPAGRQDRRRRPRLEDGAAAVALTEHAAILVDPERRWMRPLEMAGNRNAGYRAVKRAMDILGAGLLLVLFSPVMLTTLLLLTITTKGRPFFVQQRVGLCGRRFPMIKFRSMRLDAASIKHLVANEKDGPVFKNRRDPRITRIGRFIRSTSIDETPQLINVLLGHMSLVGPRPPVPEEVKQYKPWQLERLAVKPGLTCLWQISGRSEVGFEDWVRMDIWYVTHQAWRTDLTLLVRTPLAVLSRRGAY